MSALSDSYLFCDRIARTRARNFYAAFRFLPKERRLTLSAFYAFCALSDDISDAGSGLTVAERRRNLADWRSSLDACFHGRADGPVFAALSDAIPKFNLPREPFDDLLRGIEMDLESCRYPTFADLQVYCRCVASSVGKVSVRIFGCDGDGADRYADNLGIAFQLTNIIRDLAEDVRANRFYLPLADLERFGYAEEDLRSAVYDQRFMELMQFQYDRARSYFQSADPSLAGGQACRLFPAEIMKAVYRRTLEEIRRRRFRIFDRRIKAPWYGKARVIAQIVSRNML